MYVNLPSNSLVPPFLQEGEVISDEFDHLKVIGICRFILDKSEKNGIILDNSQIQQGPKIQNELVFIFFQKWGRGAFGKNPPKVKFFTAPLIEMNLKTIIFYQI